MKENFPIFNNIELVYLDNAATTQKPKIMMESLSYFYSNLNSNIGRGLYSLAQKSEEAYEYSKKTIGKFFNCSPKNIIYTSGSTDSSNLTAHIVRQHIKKKYIVLPISEHHANILVWQKIAKELNLEIYWVKSYKEIINPENIPKEILDDVAIFSIAQVSNVTGEIYPVKKWCEIAKKYNAISIVDGAQAVASINVDISDINCDFYFFSAHKIYGPMGLGVLYISDNFIDSIPLKLGGGIIEDVTLNEHIFIDGLSKFEAGTPNVANAFAFAKTLEYLNNNNWNKLLDHSNKLYEYFKSKLDSKYFSIVRLFSDLPATHIISFVVKNIHSHDVGTYLSQDNIAVRVGKHCAYPLHDFLNINSTIRVSFAIYNTTEDVDKCLDSLNNCIKYFKD